MVSEAQLQNVTLSTVLRARYGGGPLSLPLRGGAIYARFKHVQGVPSGGDQGFTISRLKALDNLIERLARLKGDSPDRPTTASAQQVDQQIEELSKQLRQELTSIESRGFQAGLKNLSVGALVNLLA